MADTYYDSSLTGAEIDQALNAISGLIAQENNGKLLYVENGRITAKSVREIGGGGTLEHLSVSANGTYTPPSGVDGYDQVIVTVPSGANLQSKTVTQNGTVTPDAGYDGLSSVVVNVPGGGGGDVESWDLTASLTGDLHGIPMTAGNVSLSAEGAVFDSTYDYLSVPLGYNGITIEIDVASMSLTSGTHRRFIMPTSEKGLIYRSTGVWAFYNGSWVDSSETDGSVFDGATVKVHVDANGHWHIYKDDVLWWEPSLAQSMSGAWYIGSSGGNTINNAVISGVRIA